MSRSRSYTSWSTTCTSTEYHPVSAEEQREPVSTDQMPEKLSKIMERTAQNFCKQLRHMHRAKERLEQATETVKFLKENPSRYPTGCGLFSSCITWSELDETEQHASEADCTWHITFARGSTKREVMSHMYHAFPIFQKEIEAQAPEDSYRNLSTRATRGAYDAVVRSPIEEFVKSEDIDINGDKPTSGVSHQMVDQFSAELYKKAKERVVKEIVDIRKRIAENLKDEAKTEEDLSERQPEQLHGQHVSSSVKKIVTTASLVQEEVKAQDVVSAVKHVSKGSRRNSNAGMPKKCDNPWGSPGGRQRSSADEKRQGERQRQAQKQIEGQRTRHSHEQRPDEEFRQWKEEHIQGSRLWNRNERSKKWRQDRREIERPKTFDDPVIQLFANLMEGATM